TRSLDAPASSGRLPTGPRLPGGPPGDADALDVALYYLEFYVNDYARARRVVKRRASTVVVWTAVANAMIAVVGTAIAVAKAPWLGLASTALAGFVGVVAAWDGIFRHRELWTQRSVILGQLQAVQRTAE